MTALATVCKYSGYSEATSSLAIIDALIDVGADVDKADNVCSELPCLVLLAVLMGVIELWATTS